MIPVHRGFPLFQKDTAVRTAAKTKADSPTVKKERRPAMKTTEVERVQLGLRVSVIWKDWLDNFAFSRRVRPVDIVDAALVAYAKAKKYEAPPSVR